MFFAGIFVMATSKTFYLSLPFTQGGATVPYADAAQSTSLPGGASMPAETVTILPCVTMPSQATQPQPQRGRIANCLAFLHYIASFTAYL